jgi:hypothetical protein
MLALGKGHTGWLIKQYIYITNIIYNTWGNIYIIKGTLSGETKFIIQIRQSGKFP